MASQDSKINSTNVGSYDYFGSSVRLSGKGNGSYNSSVVEYRAIVSAPNNEYVGNVYIFTNTTEVGGTWSQTAHILSSNVVVGDQYGYAVDIAGGFYPHVHVVSAPSKADGRGAVYIFNNSYNQTHEILGPSEYAYFGDSVKFNFQANKLIVGATGIGSAYILDSGNGYQLGTALQQGDLSDYFGFSVGIAGNQASSNWSIIGAPGANNGTGAAYIYNGTTLHTTFPLNLSGALYPSELVEGDYFGNSVALDASGDTAVVCAFLQNSQGAAHVFVRNTSTNVWSYQSKIVPKDIQVGDSFGDSVSIDSGGDTIAIGASSKLSGGAMYIFIRSGTTWTQREKIVSSNLATGDKFGYSVGVSVNARKAIAGAYSATSSSNIFSGGSAYGYSLPQNYYSNVNRVIHETVPEAEPVSTFEKFNIYVNGQPVENTPTTWSQLSSNNVTMSAPSTSNIFFGNVEYTSGLSTLEPGSKLHIGNFTLLNRNAYDTWDTTALDFYNEGPPSQMLSVGGEAIIEHKLGIGTQTPDKPLHVLGEVRVSDPFPTGTVIDISSKSSILREVSKIKPVSQLPYEVVGTSVSITKDGKTAIIGATRNPPGNETYGHVYVFDWKGNSWEQNAILQPNNVKSNDNFGTSSAISNDGKTVVVGAWRDNTVYIFTRTGDTWSQNSKLTTTSSPGDRFGYAVDVSEDGSTVVVGAPDADSVYVYMRVGAVDSWIEAHIYPTYSSSFWTNAYNSGDEFGTSVSMSADGNAIVVGAPKARVYTYYGGGTPGTIQNNAGAAYIFRRSGGDTHPSTPMSSNNSGGFIASASSSTHTPGFDTWKAFNHNTGNEGWHGTGWQYSTVTGYYTGNVSTTYDGTRTVNGEWIQLQFPASIPIQEVRILPRNWSGGPARCPGDGIILGSNDGSTWTSVHSFSSEVYTQGNYTDITFPGSPYYLYYRLVTTRLAGGSVWSSDVVNIGEIQFISVGVGTNWAQQTWLPDIWGLKEIDGGTGFTRTFPWTNASQHTINTGALFSYGHAANDKGMAHTQLTTTGTYMGDLFGNSVNISDDGNTIIVGAPGRSRTYAKTKEEYMLEDKWSKGNAYIFQFADGSWVEQANIQASDWEIFDYFGFSTAISSDGNTVMIGAFNDDPTFVDSHGNKSIIQNGGSVYIYTRTVDGVWSEKHKITPDVPVTDGAYGASLCLSSDGNTALITGASSGSGAKPAPGIPWVGFQDTAGAHQTHPSSMYNSDGTLNNNGMFLTWNGTTADGVYIYDVYSIGTQSTNNDMVRYNPNTKTWLLGRDVTNGGGSGSYSISNNNSSSNKANLPDCSIYDPEYVYLYKINTANGDYVWGWWKNPYKFTTEGTVYSYNLPDDFSNPYYNTLNVPSNLYVRDTIYTAENIGVKTSDPKRPLHVDGDVRITDNTENVDFSVDKGSIYEESILTLPRTGDGDIATENDHVGERVRISGDGYTAFVSSHTHGGGFQGGNYQHPKGGKVQVYVRSGYKWTLQATLQPDDIGSGDDFGISFGSTPDGNKLVVSSFYYNATISGTTYNESGGIWVYKREGTTWSIESFFVPQEVHDGTGDTQCAYSISISDDGSRIASGTIISNGGRGRVYVFELANNGTWYQQATLNASDGQSNNYLGIEVSISGDGNTIASGAWAADTGPGSNAKGGAVYIFVRGVDVWSNNAWQATWNQQTKIVPSDIEDNMMFGSSCMLSSDGNTLAIGARDANYPGGGINTLSSIGAAYVFIRSGSTWSQQTKLFPFDPVASSNFAPTNGISISSDGNRIAVGRNQPANTDNPATYIFDREGTIWSQFAKLTPSDGNAGEFGYCVALSSIGDRVIVGDIIKMVNGKSRAGAAYIYSLPVADNTTLNVSSSMRSRGGLLVNDNTGIGTLEPEKKLHVVGDVRISNQNNNSVDLSILTTQYEEEFTSTVSLQSSTPTSGPIRAALGVSCALSYDGDVAVTGGDSGEIYIYEKKGAEWKLHQKVRTSRTSANTWGNKLNISGDGKTIAASYINNNGGSYVSIVVRLKGIWEEKLIFDNPGLVQNNWFGHTVALDEKGDCLVVGAYNDTRTSGGSHTGVVYVYHKIEGCSWYTTPTTITAYMNSNENDANYEFGYSVDISGDGDKILVGATKAKPSTGSASSKTCGCLYGFDRNTSTNAITFYRKWFMRQPSGDDGDWLLNNDDEFGRIVRISGNGDVILAGDNWDFYDPSWGTRTNCGRAVKGLWTSAGDNGLNGIGNSEWLIGRTNNIKMGTDMIFVNYSGRVWGCSTLPEDPSSSDGVTGGSYPNCGLVYVLDSNSWHASAPAHPQVSANAIVPTTYQSNIYFGTCVDINREGTKLLIGSPYENSCGTIHIFNLPLASSTTIPSLSLSGLLNVPHGIGYDKQNPTGLAPLTVNARGGSSDSTTNGVNVVGSTDIVNGYYAPAILGAESSVADAYLSLKRTGGTSAQNYNIGFMSNGALSGGYGGEAGSSQSNDSANNLYIKNLSTGLGVFWNPDLDMYIVGRRKIHFGQTLSYDTGDYQTEGNSGSIGYGLHSNNTSNEAAALDIVGAGCEQAFSYWVRPDPTRRMVRIWDRLFIGNGTLCSGGLGDRGIIEVTQSAGNQNITYRYLNAGSDGHGPYTASGSSAVNYSIWCNGRVRSSEFNASSDERIKKDIVDVVDASALEKLRLLKPKTYKYRDKLERNDNTVYGFIAQEVANVIPYAVSTSIDEIPNILTHASVTRNDTFFPPDSNVYYMPSNVHVSESSNIFDIRLDTSVPGLSLSNTCTISITTDTDVKDSFSVVKQEGDVITITSGKEIETTNVFSNVSNAFVYGEVVSDFHNLNKDSVWTISCAALQEIDRQLQAEKTKVVTLETQVADLLARVTALENN